MATDRRTYTEEFKRDAVRLAQERFPKIEFRPLREHAGLSLGTAG